MTASPEAVLAFCLVSILLIPCAAAGLALTNAGLGRSRNASHSLLSSLAAVATAALVYFAVGFAWQGSAGRPGHALMIGGKAWNWIGAERFLLRGIELDGALALSALLGLVSAGLVAMIPVGAAGGRWRFAGVCGSTAILAGWTFPLVAHWAWGGGWLGQLGVHYGLGRGLIDSGGAASIHATGGLTALSLAWILGPRRGKYDAGGMPAAIPGHNASYVLFGCVLAWVGWSALDCAGAVLYTGAGLGRVPLVVVNSSLAAGAGLLTAVAITKARFRLVDASLSANAWVGGLVASSAGCAVVRPAAAVIIGVVAGALVVFSVEWLELYLKIDDPGGVISVHGLSGIWGLVAVGLFADFADQWIAQLVGVATLVGFVVPVSYGLNWVLNLMIPLRVSPEAERQGLDLHELGAGAYPDFVSHKEDVW